MHVNQNQTPVRASRGRLEGDELAFCETTGPAVRLGRPFLGVRQVGNSLCRPPGVTQFQSMSWQAEEWRVSVNCSAPEALPGAERPWFYFYQMPEKILSRSPMEYGDHLFGA